MILDFATKRKATKNYNPNKFVSKEDLNYVFNVTNTAPTSAGLEHWKVLSFRDKEVKKELLEGINLGNRIRFTDSSDALIFYVKKEEWFLRKDNDELLRKIKRYVDATDKIFNKISSNEDIENFLEGIKTGDHANNDRNYTEWSKRQAYIAAAFAMLSAKERGIESTPMEGFSKKLDEILREKKYINEFESVALIVLLGYTDDVEVPNFGTVQLRDKVEEKFKII